MTPGDAARLTLAASGARAQCRRVIRAIRLAAILAIAVVVNGSAMAQDDIIPDDPAAPVVAAPPVAPDAAAAIATPTPGPDGAPVAPGGEPPAPIYDEKLLRLAEILGSLSFLRDLCGDADGTAWRDDMASLLAAENPTPGRRARMVARFNHGFETFNAVYRTCTPSAKLSVARYLREGEALAADVRGRYSH